MNKLLVLVALITTHPIAQASDFATLMMTQILEESAGQGFGSYQTHVTAKDWMDGEPDLLESVVKDFKGCGAPIVTRGKESTLKLLEEKIQTESIEMRKDWAELFLSALDKMTFINTLAFSWNQTEGDPVDCDRNNFYLLNRSGELIIFESQKRR